VAFGGRIPAILLVLAALANAAVAPCSGGEAPAQARTECCAKAADHHCPQAVVDECCLSGEQRQESAQAGLPIIALLSPLLATPPPWETPAFTANALPGSSRARGTDVPPRNRHLLLSVFLI
jgi:hypothetical protein